jgi:toxin ParE1/3/4
MRLPVRRTNRAERDLDEIWLHVAADDVEAADRIIERIEAAEDRLGDFPELGQARTDLAEGLRHLPSPPYLILYRAAPDPILVVRIVHGARDLPRLLEP